MKICRKHHIIILTLPTILILTLFITIQSGAEQMLIKDSLPILGFKYGDIKFKTCSGKIILIGNGIVEETNLKCSKDTEQYEDPGKPDITPLEIQKDKNQSNPYN